MRVIGTAIFIIFTSLVLAFQALSDTFTIDTELDRGAFAVKFQANIPDGRDVKEFTLYRSTNYLEVFGEGELIKYPVTVIKIAAEKAGNSYLDRYVAHNTAYYYKVKMVDTHGNVTWSNTSEVKVPDVNPEINGKVSILVDKVHYILEISDGSKMIKRYPIALGANPNDRKLHQDNATTPEGTYHIYGVKPQATYYRAYDINYPNAVDRARYRIWKERGLIKVRNGSIPTIGGSIQIHGMGIEKNWTWGCIAMRNRDIDELFENKHIGKGTTVTIIGKEVNRKDVEQWTENHGENMIRSIQEKLIKYNAGAIDGEFGFKTSLAIGRFQFERGLPLTCDVDSLTISEILNQL
ncbi:MAG: L,D-transpeptidase family protein [Deltaproteobacteria bacterium]|nr:L,D-transpeptidase family protein [Deltaproteobacteria bacterium]